MEVTKSCVRVLTLERKLRKVILYPFELLLSLCKWVNWCIIRSLFRILGIPLLCVFLVVVCTTDPSKANDSWKFILLAFLTVIVGTGCFISWTDIPEHEQKILQGVED